MAHPKITSTIKEGASLRVGYRIRSSDDPFVYFSHQPKHYEIPYTFQEDIPPGDYEFEVTTICPNCSGPQFSTPQIVYETVYDVYTTP